MVEILKLGNKTVVINGKIISLFKKGILLRQLYYGGYEDFDNANGGTWKKYIHIPITTVPHEDAVYKLVIDSENVCLYSADGTLKTSNNIAPEFWSLVRTDGYDIRIFDHLFRQLYFWIETFDYENQYTIIWIKLPANSKELNVAFANECASGSVYNKGDHVFEFFDNFERSEVNDGRYDEYVADETHVYIEDGQLVIDVPGDLSNPVGSFKLRKYLNLDKSIIEFYRKSLTPDVGGGINGISASISSDPANNFVALTGRGGGKDHPRLYYRQDGSTLLDTDMNLYPDGKVYQILINNGYVEWRYWDGTQYQLMESYSGSLTGLDVLRVGEYPFTDGGVYSSPDGDVKQVIDNIKVMKLVDPADFGTPQVFEF